MFQNCITYDISKSSWLTVMEVQTTRFLLLAAVVLGVALFAVSLPKTAQAQEYAWCLSEEGALESAFQHIASLRREART
jgi:hypothetical protein